MAWLRAAWQRGSITPLICRETATELLRVLKKPKFRLSAMEQEMLLVDYLPCAEIVVLPQPLPALAVACRDVADEIFIQLSLAAKADFLVTGDADLLVLREAAPVRIVTLDELKVYRSV